MEIGNAMKSSDGSRTITRQATNFPLGKAPPSGGWWKWERKHSEAGSKTPRSTPQRHNFLNAFLAPKKTGFRSTVSVRGAQIVERNIPFANIPHPSRELQFLLSEPFDDPISAQKPQICPRKIGEDAHPGMSPWGPSHKYLAPMVHPLLDTR
jgi:hypothetical protein